MAANTTPHAPWESRLVPFQPLQPEALPNVWQTRPSESWRRWRHYPGNPQPQLGTHNLNFWGYNGLKPSCFHGLLGSKGKWWLKKISVKIGHLPQIEDNRGNKPPWYLKPQWASNIRYFILMGLIAKNAWSAHVLVPILHLLGYTSIKTPEKKTSRNKPSQQYGHVSIWIRHLQILGAQRVGFSPRHIPPHWHTASLISPQANLTPSQWHNDQAHMIKHHTLCQMFLVCLHSTRCQH